MPFFRTSSAALQLNRVGRCFCWEKKNHSLGLLAFFWSQQSTWEYLSISVDIPMQYMFKITFPLWDRWFQCFWIHGMPCFDTWEYLGESRIVMRKWGFWMTSFCTKGRANDQLAGGWASNRSICIFVQYMLKQLCPLKYMGFECLIDAMPCFLIHSLPGFLVDNKLNPWGMAKLKWRYSLIDISSLYIRAWQNPGSQWWDNHHFK